VFVWFCFRPLLQCDPGKAVLPCTNIICILRHPVLILPNNVQNEYGLGADRIQKHSAFFFPISYCLLSTFLQTLKYLGENFNIPILVTNQVSQTGLH